MSFETSLGDNFFTEDPVWAEDFAPNGKPLNIETFEYALKQYIGTLVKEGDIMTRKRYAK